MSPRPPHLTAEDLSRLADNAREATEFLKALGHEGRLLMLCHLASGEKTVTELERLLSSRQAAVSQQLARLRLEGLVRARRDGKAIYYSIADRRVLRMISALRDVFCAQEFAMETVAERSRRRAGDPAPRAALLGST